MQTELRFANSIFWAHQIVEKGGEACKQNYKMATDATEKIWKNISHLGSYAERCFSHSFLTTRNTNSKVGS